MTLAAALIAAAGYELAVALTWIPVGSVPGDEPVGRPFAEAAGSLAMIGGVVYFVVVAGRNRPRHWVDALIPLAVAALLVAHFYAFDSYFFPNLQRFSESGIAPGWVYGLAASAILSSTALVAWPRGGRALAVIVRSSGRDGTALGQARCGSQPASTT